jgi:hypothetical protein
MSIQRYADQQVAVRRPTITERDLSLIERQAEIIARSDVAGALKGKPADIVVIAMKAMALGVDPMSAFDDMFVIERRVSISARMRVALARSAGCEVWFEESTDTRAVCCLRRPAQTRVHRLAYTADQARTAGLAGKDNWKKHPAAMLRAAASRQLINMAAQDVLIGLPGGADIDYEAEVSDLDVGDDVVELTGPGVGERDAPVVMAAQGDVDDLLAEIGGLDGDQKAWLSDRIKTAGLPPVRHAQAGQVGAYRTLIAMAREVGECVADEPVNDPAADGYQPDEVPF